MNNLSAPHTPPVVGNGPANNRQANAFAVGPLRGGPDFSAAAVLIASREGRFIREGRRSSSHRKSPVL